MKETLRDNVLKDENKLWQEALFIFDSSALLNFYEYSEKTRQEIFSSAFEKLSGKLWITNQTEYEYLKNRDRVLHRPKKLYDDLVITHFDFKQFEAFKNQFYQLQNRTKKDDRHPHIEEIFFKNLHSQIQEFEAELVKFESELKEVIEFKKKEIDSTKENDSLKTAIYKYFQITDSYNFDKLIEIAKEGEFRYKNQIPPGYEDIKDKIGLAVYGDLFIWKQILDLAKKYTKPIILIIDDLKIDWCYQNSKDKNVADAPREELIKEFTDFVKKSFWLYSSTQFLQKSKKYLATAIPEEIIQEVKESNRFNSGPYLEVDLIWTSGGRVSKGYSDKNPIELHEDGTAKLISNHPIIYWRLNWNYKFVILNNSNYPAYNIAIESIGTEHFYQLEELPRINNLTPLNRIELNARFEDFIEGDYYVADKVMSTQIPEKFKNLILKLTYYDDARNIHTTRIEFSGAEVVNKREK